MDRFQIDRRSLLRTLGGAGAVTIVRPGLSLAQDASPAAAGTGSLTIGKALEPVGLDPALVTAAASFELIAVVYDGLVRLDEAYQPQPGLAESWETPDDTTFVFHLRPGVTFHNGQPLTADDVKFSFERIVNPDTASPWASQFEPIQAIEVVDPQTVRFVLKQPYGPLLATLAATYAVIVPQAEVTARGDLQQTMIGTGPFMLKEMQADTQITLAANPTYWEAGMPKLAEVIYRILPDEAARLAAIRTGEVGLTPLTDTTSVGLADESDGVSVVTFETTDYYLLGINCQKAPYDNPQVRRALSLAVDRQALLDAVFFGQGSLTGSVVPTLGDWGADPATLPYFGPDPEQAKALLAEAGVGAGMTMTILTSPLYPEFNNIALVLQQQLEAVGIAVQLDQVEFGTFVERWRARDFETFVSFNGSGNDPDRALYPVFHTGGSVNAFQFSEPELDTLLEEGRTTLDAARRHEIYQEVQQRVADAAPALFFATRVASFAHRETVAGFAPTAVNVWETLKQTTVEE